MMFDQPVLFLDAEHYPLIPEESKRALAVWFASVGVELKRCREMWRYQDEVLLIMLDRESSRRWKQLLTSWRVVPADDLPVLDMPRDVAQHMILSQSAAFQPEGTTT